MSHFGTKSLLVLETLTPDLQLICTEGIKHVGFTLLCGFRGQKDQTTAFKSKKSKTPWPQSKHNHLPSRAFDFKPDQGSKDIDYAYVAGILIGIAIKLKDEGRITIPVRYGGDFNENGQVSDDGWDWGHIEEDV